MPAPPTAGQHAALVQLRRDGPQAGRAGRPDVLDHWRGAPRVPLGVSRKSGPQRRTALARPPDRRDPVLVPSRTSRAFATVAVRKNP